MKEADIYDDGPVFCDCLLVQCGTYKPCHGLIKFCEDQRFLLVSDSLNQSSGHSALASSVVRVQQSDLNVLWCGEFFVGDVAGVQNSAGLEAENFSFFIGAGAVFGAARDDQTFTGVERDDAIAKLNAKATLPDEEKFVFVVVMVLGEFAKDFDDFDFLIVQSGDDLGTPVFIEKAEFISEVDFGGHSEFSFECN